MKNLIITILAMCLINIVVNAQTTPAEQLANKIAQRMKDTLSLSDAQKTQLYNINMQLHQQKMNVRQQYQGSDYLTYNIQRVENTRDSLYRTVLADDKYLLYKQKKRTLVSNN
ncbi:MAG: hypothetical protein JST29_01465 [Bacteroidetes bacterium]|nr:hypothetical protein [Bacteroidota bacterium]